MTAGIDVHMLDLFWRSVMSQSYDPATEVVVGRTKVPADAKSVTFRISRGASQRLGLMNDHERFDDEGGVLLPVTGNGRK